MVLSLPKTQAQAGKIKTWDPLQRGRDLSCWNTRLYLWGLLYQILIISLCSEGIQVLIKDQMAGSPPFPCLCQPPGRPSSALTVTYYKGYKQAGEKLPLINPLISVTRTSGCSFEGYRGQNRNRKCSKHEEHLSGSLLVSSCRTGVAWEESCSRGSEL